MDFYTNIDTAVTIEKKIKKLQENICQDMSRPTIIVKAINEFFEREIKKARGE